MSAAPAISRPTPAWTTASGQVIRLRPLAPGDAGRFGKFLRGLSFGTRYFRFGRGDFDLSEADLGDVCDPDPQQVVRWVAVVDAGDDEAVVGAAGCYLDADGRNCDLAILVADAWQGSRVAHRLMAEITAAARARGLATMRARVLATNRRMIGFARRHGFVDAPPGESEAIRTLILDLSGAVIHPE